MREQTSPAEPTQAEPGGVELRARFLACAAHDLRGALANVRSFAALLLSRGLLEDERARRSAEAILRNADRALALSRDVFDSLRHELGAMPVDAEPLDLRALLGRAIKQVELSLGERPLRLELELHPELPRVLGDAERMVHALAELLLQCFSRAGPKGTVRCSARPLPEQVQLEISDQGPPRSAEELARVSSRDRAVAYEKRLGEAFRLCFAREELEAQGARVGFSASGAGNAVSVLLLRARAG